MGKRFLLCLGLPAFFLPASLPVLTTGCAEVPFTGRRQLRILSDSEEASLGIQAYKEVLSQEKISRDPAATELVNRVGRRIAEAAPSIEPAAAGYEWEFTVIDEPKTLNAFALPGGKVAVYTGILPVTMNEAGLAVVMGHEVAHVLAHHGNERMSQSVLVELGAAGISIGMSNRDPAVVKKVLGIYGVGTQFGAILPYSRKHEAEADIMGLHLMARAGYDPREAVAFWQRMDTASQGPAPPEILSTHPGHGTRIRTIEENLPKALAEYRPP